MFKYCNLNRNPNLGFFKHSNDDYNFINLNKLASNNPYIGYFSQFKNKGCLGLLPENSNKLFPYKIGNPKIISGNTNLFKNNKSNLNNFSSLNHLLFGKNLLNLEPFSPRLTKSITSESDSFNFDSVEINSEISDDFSIDSLPILKDAETQTIITLNDHNLDEFSESVSKKDEEDEYILV